MNISTRYSDDPQIHAQRTVLLEHAHTYLSQRLIDAVLRGKDDRLPSPGSRFASLHPVSAYLGESSPKQQALLLHACHLAMSQAPADDVAAALRAFVAFAADDYADDYADDLVGGGE